MEINNKIVQIIRFWNGILNKQELNSFVEWMANSTDNIEKVFFVYDILLENDCLEIPQCNHLDKVWDSISKNK